MTLLPFKTPSLPEEFAIIDRKDEEQIIAELLGEPDLLDYGYTIEETGAVGISYRGAQALATQVGGLVTDTPYVSIVHNEVVAVVAATNLHTRVRLCGSASHPLVQLGMPSPFAKEKAIGKATRNAILLVIPFSLRKRFLSEWLHCRDECEAQSERQSKAVQEEIDQFAQTKRIHDSGDGVAFDAMEAYLMIVARFGEALATRAMDEVVWKGVPRWRRNFHLVSRPQMVAAWKYLQRIQTHSSTTDGQ